MRLPFRAWLFGWCLGLGFDAVDIGDGIDEFRTFQIHGRYPKLRKTDPSTDHNLENGFSEPCIEVSSWTNSLKGFLLLMVAPFVVFLLIILLLSAYSASRNYYKAVVEPYSLSQDQESIQEILDLVYFAPQSPSPPPALLTNLLEQPAEEYVYFLKHNRTRQEQTEHNATSLHQVCTTNLHHQLEFGDNPVAKAGSYDRTEDVVIKRVCKNCVLAPKSNAKNVNATLRTGEQATVCSRLLKRYCVASATDLERVLLPHQRHTGHHLSDQGRSLMDLICKHLGVTVTTQGAAAAIDLDGAEVL